MLRSLRASLVVLETWLAAGSLLLLLVLVAAQAVARNVFDTGFASFDQLARYLVFYVTFPGAALAIEHGRHIRIDALNVLLPRRARRLLARPLHLTAAIVCGVLGYAAVRFWREEWSYAQAPERWLVLVELILPAGFILLALHFTLSALTGPAMSTEEVS